MNELIIKVEWYSPVGIAYNGYRIMSQTDWGNLQELIKTETQVEYSNTPGHWQESFPASDLSDAFSIFSGPGAKHPDFAAPMTEEEHQNTLQTFKKLFSSDDIGNTSIIDSILDEERQRCMVEDDEEEENRTLTGERFEELLNLYDFESLHLALEDFDSIEDAAAESLSKLQGYLYLEDLNELSDTAAKSLSKHQGELILGLREISDAAAESLSKHQGGLSLGLREISDVAAELLMEHKGQINDMDPKEWIESLKPDPGIELLKQKAIDNGIATPENVSEIISNLSMEDFKELRGELTHLKRIHFKYKD